MQLTGQAAEHIRFALINSTWYDVRRKEVRLKQAGRGGTGTVFRQKNLKALVVKIPKMSGKLNNAADQDLINETGKRMTKEVSENDPVQNSMATKGTPVLVEIMDVFEESDETYGSPRITKELRVHGWTVSKNRVARIMKGAELRARKPKRFKVTTDSKHNYPVAPNLLDQEFYASRPGEVWVSDITHYRTKNGWQYLTIIVAGDTRQ